MFRALADLAHRRPKRVLVLTAVFTLVAGALGGPVAGILTSSNSFEDPSSQSVRAREQIVRATGTDAGPGLIALVRVGRDVRSATGQADVARLAAFLRRDPAVARVTTYFDARDPRLLSRNGTETYLPVTFRATFEEGDAAERISDAFARDPRVTIGGTAIAGNQVGEQVQSDLAVAELLAFPILFVLSLLIFRSLVAALLPLFVGGVAIVGTFLALRGLNELTSLSVFAVNLVTGLGLGLAIDYSLFIVSRYREELAQIGHGQQALRRTLATAGRAVAFSALTVAAALASLLLFPLKFLYSMGLGGAIVALLAAAAALVALPALLAVLGPRLDAVTLGRWRAASARAARPATAAPGTGSHESSCAAPRRSPPSRPSCSLLSGCRSSASGSRGSTRGSCPRARAPVRCRTRWPATSRRTARPRAIWPSPPRATPEGPSAPTRSACGGCLASPPSPRHAR